MVRRSPAVRVLAPSLALLVCALVAAPVPARDVETLGPAPRNENGRFDNPVGPLFHATFGVRFPFFMRRIGGAFRKRPGAPERIANDGAFLRENARHSVPTITWVGHSTLLVQMDHVTFLTDPIWSKTPSPIPFLGPRRFVEPGLALEDLPPIDFVVVSHNHYDHLDLATLERLAERGDGTLFLVPLGNGELLRERGIEPVEELDWGERRRVGAAEVVCLPSQHWSQRGMRDERRALWSSWAVLGPDRRFNFGGDTGYFPGFEAIGAALGPFDLAALPIGAYAPVEMMRNWHLDPEEAVRAGRDLRAQRVVAIHFGTFDLSDEPLAEPPDRFRAAAADAGIPEADAWVLRIGETRSF